MGYYGEFVANTAIAKEGTRPFPSRALGYLRNFVDVYWLWIPVLCLAIGGLVPAVRYLRRQGASAWAYAPIVAVPLAGLLNRLRDGHRRRLLQWPPPAARHVRLVAPFAVLPVRRTQVVAFLTVAWAVGTAMPCGPCSISPDSLLDPAALGPPTPSTN